MTLTGRKPLLMCKLDVEDLNAPKPKIYKDEDEAAKRAYIDEIDGKRVLYVPDVNIYTMILQSCARRKIQKISARSMLAGLMEIVPEKIPICTLEHPEGTDEYEIDVRYVNVQRAKVRRARPKIRNWILHFDIIYADTIGNPHIIEEILEEAGYRSGLLDYRPQHLGPFGTFNVTKFEVEGEET